MCLAACAAGISGRARRSAPLPHSALASRRLYAKLLLSQETRTSKVCPHTSGVGEGDDSAQAAVTH